MNCNSERRKYILLFLVSCLLLFGVCIDEVSAHSILRAENCLDGEFVLSDCAVLGELEELILQQSDLRVRQFCKKDNNRIYSRIIAGILLCKFSLQTILYVYGITKRQRSVNSFSHKFIIGYIHQTDGEKESWFSSKQPMEA